MCERSQSDPTGDQLEHAIKRNFGGHEKMQTLEIFKSKISQLMTRSLQREDINVSEEVRREGRLDNEWKDILHCCSLEQYYILTALHWG